MMMFMTVKNYFKVKKKLKQTYLLDKISLFNVPSSTLAIFKIVVKYTITLNNTNLSSDKQELAR